MAPGKSKKKGKTPAVVAVVPVPVTASAPSVTEVLEVAQDVQPAVTAEDIEGYKVLEWKLKHDSSCVHNFFVKEHRAKNPLHLRKPNGRTLIVMNIPPFISRESLEDMFEVFGKITEIFIHQNPTLGLPEEDDPYFPNQRSEITGYRMAYIVFRLSSSVHDLLQLNSKDIDPLILSGNLKTGLAKWVSEYNQRVIDVSTIESHIKIFMANYEKDELRRKEEAKNNEGVPDDEGWITVTRKGKRPGTRLTEKTEERLKTKKRRQEKKLMNFTPRQIKESRATQLLELKKKFDEDKQRVRLIKQQRKFKPF